MEEEEEEEECGWGPAATLAKIEKRRGFVSIILLI